MQPDVKDPSHNSCMELLKENKQGGRRCLVKFYLVCALLTTVSAGNMLKKGKKYQITWSVLYSSHITTSARLSNLSVPSGCGTSTAALTESHMKPNVSVWERTKPAAPTHTRAHTHLSARQPERTPLLPYTERCQALRRANNELTFINRVTGPFGTDEQHRCLRTGHLAHSHCAVG